MDITITYRPFAGTVTAWNALDDIMSDLDREDIKRVYQDGNDDAWFVAMDTLNGHFHAITVLDCHGAGEGWNLFLSEHLNDDTITTIYNQITEWDTLTPQDSDTRTLVSASYKTTITVK
jgi:hypothetical protein